MATVIKVKRKNSTGNGGVTLQAGEPYYNLVDKKLYVASETGAVTEKHKHIAEITMKKDAPDDCISFTIGEAAGNTFEKTINNVETAKTAKGIAYYGTDGPDSVENADEGTVYIKYQEEDSQ